MVTMPETTGIVSSLPAGLLADRFGRKIVILISAPTFFIGWIIFMYFKTLWSLYLGRLLQGIGLGIVYSVIPTYLGEIASPKYRGAVSSMFYCMMWAGFLLEYILGSLLSFDNFTYECAFTSVVFFAAFVWQPESPYFYLMTNNVEDARRSLSWFLNISDEEVEKELDRIKLSVDEDMKKKVSASELIATSADRKALLILFLVGLLRQFSGITPLSSYSTQTLTSAGDDFFISPDNVTILMGVFLLLGSICGFFTIDIFGRRPLLLWSSLISTVSTFCPGTYYLLKAHTSVDVSSFAWVPPISLIILSGASVAGIFPVNVAYSSELFPSNTRGTVSSLFSIYATLIGLIILKFYLTLYYNFGAFVNFYMYSGVSLVIILISYFILPETKGKTFEQIRKELERE